MKARVSLCNWENTSASLRNDDGSTGMNILCDLWIVRCQCLEFDVSVGIPFDALIKVNTSVTASFVMIVQSFHLYILLSLYSVIV